MGNIVRGVLSRGTLVGNIVRGVLSRGTLVGNIVGGGGIVQRDIHGGKYCPGGYCPEGHSRWEILSGGVLSRGTFTVGNIVRGGGIVQRDIGG